MSKRGEYLKACTDRHLSYDTIMNYIDRARELEAAGETWDNACGQMAEVLKKEHPLPKA